MKKAIYSALLMICCCAVAVPAHAYVGPGAGLSAIGSILAFLGAIFLLIVGFFWYPMKRLLKGKKDDRSQMIINNTDESNSGYESASEESKVTKK